MGLFDCRGCKAKDSEIAHLIAQLDKLSEMVERSQKRVTELAEPGITNRLLGPSAARGSSPRPPVRLVPGFPGYAPERAKPAYEVDEGGES